MDQTLPGAGGYSRQQHHQQQHQQQQQPLLFPSSQLPSPSQLHSRQTASNNTLSTTLPNLNIPPGRYDIQQQQQQQQWSPQRTSSSRDELHPVQQQQQQSQPHQHAQQSNIQQLQQQHQQQNLLPAPIKRESTSHGVMHAKDGNSSNHNNTAASSSRVPLDDAMPSTSDFVKKLYKMLEDQSFQPVVSWGPQGDCFVVKDMNEFTKSILPRMFKHSNFASFVRQLNKYDFHKVKNTDDMMQFGEQSWTFRHPDFHADRREALENIKRKVPAQRKQSVQATASAPTPSAPAPIGSHHHHPRRHSRRHRSRSPSYSHSHSYSRSPSPSSPHQLQIQHQMQDLHSQVTSLQSQLRTQEARERELEERVRRLERGQGDVLQGLVGVQRGMAMQDGVVRGLVGGWVGIDGQETC